MSNKCQWIMSEQPALDQMSVALIEWYPKPGIALHGNTDR